MKGFSPPRCMSPHNCTCFLFALLQSTLSKPCIVLVLLCFLVTYLLMSLIILTAIAGLLIRTFDSKFVCGLSMKLTRFFRDELNGIPYVFSSDVEATVCKLLRDDKASLDVAIWVEPKRFGREAVWLRGLKENYSFICMSF